MNPIEWLKSRVQYAALAGAAALCFVGVMALSWVLLTTNWTLSKTTKDLNASRAETQEAARKLGVCQAAQTGLQAALNDQNAAVALMSEKAARDEKIGLARLAEAQREAARYRSQAERLAGAKPADPANLCVSADRLITDTLKSERGQ